MGAPIPFTSLGLSSTITVEGPTTTAEPASLALLGFGGVGLLGYGWRRRARAAA
jgi:hypothetical protein